MDEDCARARAEDGRRVSSKSAGVTERGGGERSLREAPLGSRQRRWRVRSRAGMAGWLHRDARLLVVVGEELKNGPSKTRKPNIGESETCPQTA